MKLELLVKTPDGRGPEVVNTASAGSPEELAKATEYLLKMRDRWVDAGLFAPGSTFKTRIT